GFLALGQNRAWGERVPEQETLLDVATPVGDAYWQLMNLAGGYAYAGREWVARKVVALLGGREEELVHNHHNFAWQEEHGGERFYVVRKGATPAFPGQKGFVGGSMGDDAVIIQGVASDEPAVPELVQLVERRAPHGDPAPFGEPLDRLEAAREFVVRLLECGARIDLELARQVHHCEQEIANLIFNRVPFPFSRFPVQFSQFLCYLGARSARIRPVKPHVRGALLDPEGGDQGVLVPWRHAFLRECN